MTESVLTPSVVVPWYREITAKQWYALLAGQLGWALDAFDVMLYAFCLTTIMDEWHLKPAEAGFMVSVTLFASSFGGILFGWIADRVGRKKALMATVLVFSLCSGLSGLAQDLTQLAIARTLLGLGMGGEWASGALLVSETWPAQHRGKAIGFMQSGWAIGYIAAAIAGATILPRWGWRAMFFVGIVPALFTLWIRRRVDEPEIWIEARRTGTTRSAGGSLLQIFRPDLLRFTLLCTLTSAFVMFAYWGLFTWMPGYLASPIDKGGAGLGIAKAPIWIIPMMVGALIGYITFGFIADKIGRRPTFAAYLVISAVLVWIFGKTQDSTELMVLGPLVGFFGSGYFSVFGAFIAELFPTRARGAAVGFCYNAGRMLSALAPTLIGSLSLKYGLGGALTFLAIAFIGGAITIYFLPETRGRQLA
ncbi:MAG: MFS transporter [Deltaproteobacteria bacterium]|nr:MAG: MFS transporter [Deltaproteobacteria bacterium]TMQ21783.1 MAG: MFS transporter [Deltaproteobacteria bacterium]